MNNAILKNKVRELAAKHFSEAVSDRRHLHMIPEMGFKEFKTSDYIKKQLQSYDISFKSGIAKTGVMGMIETNKPGKVIALRADMDALPITEKNFCDYTSTHSGYMHACGHDVHMACLLGTARILNELKHELRGAIKLFFQPSEETFPGGAIAMIDEGVLENPKVEHVIGMHVLPTMDAGYVGFKEGMYMASTDEIYLTVKGKGGHAATPELLVNPLVVASHILLKLDELFKQQKHKGNPYVLSFGKIIGEGRTNIVPDEVKIDGTFRAYDETWRYEAQGIIEKTSKEIAESMGASCHVRIEKGYPFLENDAALTKRLFNASVDLLDAEHVLKIDMRLTAEDFAYFSKEVASCFFRLGTRNIANNIISNLHTDTFEIDESAIKTGIETMAWLSISELQN